MLRFTHRLFGSRLHTQTMVLCHLSLYMTCLEHDHQHRATRERDKGPDRRKCAIFLASCYLTQAMGLQLKWGLCNSWTIHGILQARILEWVAFPFSRGSSQPRDRTQVSHVAGRSFTSWATREAPDSKESACNAGNLDSIPGLGRSPGEGIGYLENYEHKSLAGYSPWSCRVRHNWAANPFTLYFFYKILSKTPYNAYINGI